MLRSTTSECADPRREFRLGQDLWDAWRASPPRKTRAAAGKHVLVIPGFGTNDSAMRFLHRDLRTRGFITHRWKLGLNLGPTKTVMSALSRRVRDISKTTGQPVHLVGWSMGGVLARSVAPRVQGLVGRVVTLGSPLSGDPSCSWLSGLVARCAGMPMHHRLLRRWISAAALVPVISIYSRNDGIVHWQASTCVRGEVARIEVEASHLGMVVSPRVFDAVASALTRRDPSA